MNTWVTTEGMIPITREIKFILRFTDYSFNGIDFIAGLMFLI